MADTKMDNYLVEVRIWNEDCSDYEDKLLEMDEFDELLAEYRTKAERTPAAGRRQWVWFADMIGRDGYGAKSNLLAVRYEFYSSPKMGTRAELQTEYLSGPLSRKMFVVKAAGC